MSLVVPTMAEKIAKGEVPEILFWVGCSGSFDDRAKKITKALVKILNSCKVDFAVLGAEESCTGDPAKRAGNEFTFQMQAMMNIQVLDGYEVKKIVTACPHCFNTLKNEYPELGGNYEVIHHTQLIQELINQGKLVMKEGDTFKGKAPLGVFELVYASGENWYGEELKFGPKTQYTKSDNVLFFQKMGRQINGHTVSLKSVVGGNMKSRALSAQDF